MLNKFLTKCLEIVNKLFVLMILPYANFVNGLSKCYPVNRAE